MSKRPEKTYYDPKHPLGFTGNTLALSHANIPRRWLAKQPTYTLHKPVRRRGFPMREYRTTFPNSQWQADLVDMQGLKRVNKGFGHILTAIDIFSRYAFATPLKTKHFSHVIEGFERIFAIGKSPHLLQTDEGSEFLNKNIQSFFQKHKVHQFCIKSEYKAAIVERFHRTLRSRMYRYFTKSGTQQWIDVLPHLLTSYNTATHSALYGATPSEIYNDMDAESQLRNIRLESDAGNKSKPKLHMGDIVRVALTKKTFDRGYTPNWTHDLYKIVNIDNTHPPPMYSVVHLDTGEQIQGKFYHQNLQVVYK